MQKITLTREEGKLITRHRLMEAGVSLLQRYGSAGFSTSAVTREAGVAQPTFYVHFRDKDDLFEAVIQERIAPLRQKLLDTRKRMFSVADASTIRETFLIPVEVLTSEPQIFRLYLQERWHPDSPVGKFARSFRSQVMKDLRDDLVRLGVPAASPSERERLDLAVEGMISLTESYALGLVEGRFTDKELVISSLVAFALGCFQSLPVPKQ